MGTPYIGEIRMFGGNFAPAGWALCQGQLMAIVENETLFQLIGTTYGGDGVTTFALPNLQSRVPIHKGTIIDRTFSLGETGGQESVTLTINQIPSHNHVARAQSATGALSSPQNGLWAKSSSSIYSNVAPSVNMNAGALGNDGGSQPHDNMIPFLVINFIIALFGVFPTQN